MYLYFPNTPPILDHPPYSPDLAPSDFHLFLHLKKHLAGKKFEDDDDEVQEAVMTWFKGKAADFYDSGIQKPVPRLNKYLDNAGEYVENKVIYRQFIDSVAVVN
jgi:histone-lysine N-methyltransferase SETMAR